MWDEDEVNCAWGHIRERLLWTWIWAEEVKLCLLLVLFKVSLSECCKTNSHKHALMWFPRESHASEGETAQVGLLDPAQCNSKGSAESFKNSKGKTDLKSMTIYLRKKDWKTKCRTLPSSKVTASKSDLLVQKLNCSQFLFYFWQLKLFCFLPLQKEVSHSTERHINWCISKQIMKEMEKKEMIVTMRFF